MIINRLLRKIQQLELKITVLQERNDELSKSPKAAKVLLLPDCSQPLSPTTCGM
jgi:hypothetical protein